VRKLSGYPGLVVGVVAVAMAAYHVYARLTWYAPDQQALLYITLAFSLTLSFLLYPLRAGATPDRIPWADLVLTALSLAVVGYMFVYYDYVVNRFPTAHPLATADKVVGVVGILLVLEATRRTIGVSLPIVAAAFLLYGLAGPWLPGVLYHRGLSLELTVDQTYFTTEGVFGVPLGVAGTYVILFIVFGAFLEKSGAGQFFMNFANALAGGARGGPGKVAVVGYLMDRNESDHLANLAVGAMLGVEKSLVLKRALSEFVHPEDRDMLKGRVLEAVRTRERVLRLEYRLTHRDGSVRWVADRRQMIYGEDGKLRWVDGLILDITDRKRSDVALRLTQFTVDRGSESIYWMGPDGHLIYVNDRTCETLGYSREELLSMKIQEINPEFPPERWPYHWDELRNRRIFWAESTHRSRDGRLIPVELTANYIEFDGKEYNCVYAHDITTRKRNEELIVLERDFTKAVLDSLPGIFYLFDRKGKFLRWNNNFEKITGYSAEEIGKLHLLDLFEGPDKALIQSRITDAFAKGTSEVEAELVTKTGQKMTYYFTGHTFQVKEEPCLIGTGIDISERKKLEEQLRKSQKMEAMGLLAGGIAHDFNNLLTGILGYANLLSLKEGLVPEVSKAAGIIQRSAEKASQLTAQLLGFAEKGKNLTVPVELGRVIASVTGVLERTQDPGIRIVTSLHPEVGCVLGDPSQLDQVVMNLAINSCDAMPRGGQLKITTEPVTLDEVFCRERDWMSPGRYIRLSVSDTGVGIPPENMVRIFDPFFTTKDHGTRTGLGLSMVFGIVKNHGGCVDVRSEAGAGTVVRVFLPESPEGAPKGMAEMDPALPRGRGRILLVDDQEPVREVHYIFLALSDRRNLDGKFTHPVEQVPAE